MRILQVGVGNWGRDWHANVLLKHREAEVVALVDADRETLTRAGREFKFEPNQCFRTLDDALASVDCEAVLVTATLQAHGDACRTALAADKHVLCEKPFAETVGEAVELTELAAAKDRILMVSQNYRHFPAMRWLARAVRQERYGRLASISIDFRQYANGVSNTNRRYLESWHPLLVDMAIHHLDLLRFVVAAEPTEVSCTAQNPAWSRFRDPPSAVATITFPSGVVVSYRGSWISHGPATPWAGLWQVEFEHALLAVRSRSKDDGTEDAATVYRDGTSLGEPIDLDTDGLPVDRLGTLSEFIASVDAGHEPETSARDNVRTLALMHAMIRSAETHAAVTLQQPN
ncbi:MAG: Gfo/Idh/MocA family protein [Spirochaetota bacterium]